MRRGGGASGAATSRRALTPSSPATGWSGGWASAASSSPERSGSALALGLGDPVAAAAGFVAIGRGIACVFPITLQITTGASSRPGHPIAAVCTLGYTGFLIGPPTIGLAAELTSLPLALGLLPALAGIVALAVSVAIAPAEISRPRPS